MTKTGRGSRSKSMVGIRVSRKKPAIFTYEALSDEYFSSVYADTLSPSTVSSYQNYDKALRGLFEGINLHSVNAYLADKAYRRLLETRSVSFSNGVMTFAKIVWNFGKRYEWVERNPFSGIKVLPVADRDTTWTPEQLEAVVDKLTETGKVRELLFLLLCYWTCQRPGDVAAIKLANVRDGGIFIPNKKTGKNAFCPLEDECLTQLKVYVASYLKPGAEYLFQSPMGKHIKYITFYQSLRVAMQAVGLKDVTLRDLRRTAITEGAEAGWTEEEMLSYGQWGNRAIIKKYSRPRTRIAINANAKRWKLLSYRKQKAREAAVASIELPDEVN